MSGDKEPGFYLNHMGQRQWWDGERWGALDPEVPRRPKVEESTVEFPPSPPPLQETTELHGISITREAVEPPQAGKPKWGRWVWISVAAVLAILLVVTFGVERWEKVIDPEHPETFHTIEVESGAFHVAMDNSNPCWVGQYWYDCIDEYVTSYNHACAERYIAFGSEQLCADYGKMIDEMNAENADEWSTVSELGTWGRLSVSPEMVKERVSNGDYRPAKTRSAVCLLWVFVECRWHESLGDTGSRPVMPAPSEGEEAHV